MAASYGNWLEKHMKEANAKYKRLQQKGEKAGEGDDDFHEEIHQMWGYLAALEKCSKQLKASEKPKARKKAA